MSPRAHAFVSAEIWIFRLGLDVWVSFCLNYIDWFLSLTSYPDYLCWYLWHPHWHFMAFWISSGFACKVQGMHRTAFNFLAFVSRILKYKICFRRQALQPQRSSTCWLHVQMRVDNLALTWRKWSNINPESELEQADDSKKLKVLCPFLKNLLL